MALAESADFCPKYLAFWWGMSKSICAVQGTDFSEVSGHFRGLERRGKNRCANYELLSITRSSTGQ